MQETEQFFTCRGHISCRLIAILASSLFEQGYNLKNKKLIRSNDEKFSGFVRLVFPDCVADLFTRNNFAGHLDAEEDRVLISIHPFRGLFVRKALRRAVFADTGQAAGRHQTLQANPGIDDNLFGRYHHCVFGTACLSNIDEVLSKALVVGFHFHHDSCTFFLPFHLIDKHHSHEIMFVLSGLPM